MTIPDATRAIMAAQEYIKQFTTLNEKGFAALLADNVSCVHTRIKDGVDSGTVELNGKKNVSVAYHKHFFAITGNLDLRYESYKGSGLQASIECEVAEDKNEDNTVRRYRILSNIELTFREEEGTLKVVKIWERTSKTPL